MEIKKIVNQYGIIGVVSNYKSNFKCEGKVRDLLVNNLLNALKIVNLDVSILDKDINELTLSEIWKLELITKLNNKVIIIGNLFNSLNYKDIEYMKKLFIKLNTSYNKKIIIIDNNIEIFFGLVKKILVVNKHEFVYETEDFFDDNLYKYVKMPKIIEFIKYVNKDKYRINETTDIYELIKDIYRVV